ncbi:phage upper tail fiber protein [Methanobrevibacter woesei]
MYLAKSTGSVYMDVEYGIFDKFRFMTQAAYDALSSYNNDTIYFVRSS